MEWLLTSRLNQLIDKHQILLIQLYQLLQNTTPIDAMAFHEKCHAFLDKKLALLEHKRAEQLFQLQQKGEAPCQGLAE